MAYYDPAMVDLINQMIQCLDHDADMTRGYVDQLRQLDYTLWHILQDAEAHAPTPEQDALMRQALSLLDPRVGDQYLGYGEVLRRVQEAVECELFRWDSSTVQPVGLSGHTQIAVGGGQWDRHTATAEEIKPPPTAAASAR